MMLFDPVEWYIAITKADVATVKQELDLLSVKNAFDGKGAVDYFLPKCFVKSKSKDLVIKEMPDTYVFIHCNKKEFNEIKNAVPSLNLMKPLNKATGCRGHMTLNEETLMKMRLISNVLKGYLPCFDIDAFDVSSCDRVLVDRGLFKGLEGPIFCQIGKDGGQVLIPVNDYFIAATPEIPFNEFRTLEFGKGTRHHTQQFEAHIPKVVNAVVERFTTGKLSDKVAEEMEAFIWRYGLLRSATMNVYTFHNGLMLLSYVALDDKEKINNWMRVCNILKRKISDSTQLGLLLTMMFAATGDDKLKEETQNIIDSWPKKGDTGPLRNRRKTIIELFNKFDGLHNSLKWIKA